MEMIDELKEIEMKAGQVRRKRNHLEARREGLSIDRDGEFLC